MTNTLQKEWTSELQAACPSTYCVVQVHE